MKQILALILMCGVLTASAQEKGAQKEALPSIDKYFFVMIKTGPRTDFDSTERAKLFKGHMDNMTRLANEGILKIAGPFAKNEFNWRGIFIFDCKSLEEAQEIVKSDPAVAAGLFAVDIVPWYSSPDGNLKHGKPEKPF